MRINPVQAPSASLGCGYILIEPSNLPTRSHRLLDKTHPCVPPLLWAAELSMPRLLRLDKLASAERRLVSELIQQEASEQYPPVICAWLQSDIRTEELADSIARLIYGLAPNGDTVLWRYYDPRVFILTAHVFSDVQGDVLLGKVERWIFPWRRQWWSVNRSKPFIPSPADLDTGWPTIAQWNVLLRSRLFHQMHARLHDEGKSTSRCIDELNESVQVFQETANYIHLGSDELRAEFTYLATRYRKAFRASHELLPRHAQLRRQEITLHQMIESITPQDVALMAARLFANGGFV